MLIPNPAPDILQLLIVQIFALAGNRISEATWQMKKFR